MAELTSIANNGRNNVVLLMDIAYIDFAAPECRKVFQLFNNLPENFLVLVSFSMSKGYTMYGYRLGCLLCVSSNKQEVEDFIAVNKFSSRATWSNCSRLGMQHLPPRPRVPQINRSYAVLQLLPLPFL